MEEYKTHLYGRIFKLLELNHSPKRWNSAGLHKSVKRLDNVKCNYKDGLLHSEYMGDRYEPAIIIHHHIHVTYVYLFDGDIRDCIHPCIVHIDHVEYYSSERIKQNEPIHIDRRLLFTKYNVYGNSIKIDKEHSSCCKIYKYTGNCVGLSEEEWIKYTTHDSLEVCNFKFAD